MGPVACDPFGIAGEERLTIRWKGFYGRHICCFVSARTPGAEEKNTEEYEGDTKRLHAGNQKVNFAPTCTLRAVRAPMMRPKSSPRGGVDDSARTAAGSTAAGIGGVEKIFRFDDPGQLIALGDDETTGKSGCRSGRLRDPARCYARQTRGGHSGFRRC